MRNTFRNNFGRNPVWWLTGLAALAVVIVLELAVSGIRRVYFPTDQDLMQEVEKNRAVKGVVRDHAGITAEEGEAGPDAQRAGEDDDADDDKTRASSTDMERWSFSGGSRRRLSDAASTSVPASGSRRVSRLGVEEYVPPPFTPPVEERDDPFAAAFSAGSSSTKKG